MFRASLVVLAMLVTVALTDLCPSERFPENCACETHSGSQPQLHMTCFGFTDSAQVLSALSGSSEVYSFRLLSTTLPSLPMGMASPTLANLEIINCSIPYISSPLVSGSVFDGMLNLSSITIKGVQDLSGWDWSKLAPLKNLKSLHIENSRLPALPTSFSLITSTQPWSLAIINTQTRSIAPSVLGNNKLQAFVSRGNPLGSVRAAMFLPGKALTYLELVGTKVTGLAPREFGDLSFLNTFVTDAHLLSFLGPNPFNKPLHSFTLIGDELAPCRFKYCFLRDHGLQWDAECVVETSTNTAKFIMAEFLTQAC